MIRFLIVFALLAASPSWAQITDDFTGTAGTAIDTHDANWTAGPFSITHSQLDGSGFLELSNLFQTNNGYYADGSLGEDSDSKVTFNGSLTAVAGLNNGPTIRTTGTQLGYGVRIQAISGNNVSTLRFLRGSGSSWSSFATPSVANTYDMTSATPISLELSINGSDQLVCTITQGATTETLTTSADGTPLTGGQPGYQLSPGNTSGIKIDEWSTTDGGGGGGDTPLRRRRSN